MHSERTIVLENARLVLADRVIEGGWVALCGGIIAEVGEGRAPERGEDLDGDLLMPGLVELHTDHLEAHYAPSAKVRLMDAKSLQTGLDVLGANAAHIAVWARTPLKSRSQRIVQRRMPDDAAATAQQLFAVLRAFDAEGVKLIWVETPPQEPEWEGVRDRLQRAAAA